uniref:UDP glucuronosyltransferase 5 family, polypeptide D1 n=1 Tax=Sinocyclocheilus anshuiensis TaxID=1608454 RepID=A0A671PAS2_9TELE
MKSLSNQSHFIVGLFLAFSVFTLSCSGGKVLLYPVDGSHWVNMKVLIDELHYRGHSITVIRPKSSWYITKKSPLYNSITIADEISRSDHFFEEYLWKMIEIERGDASGLFLKLQFDLFSMLSKAHYISCKMVSAILEDKMLVKRLQDERYDLVLTDPALAGGVFLAHYLKLPLVLNVRWITSGEGHFAIAPSPLPYMSFPQRVKNVLFQSFTFFQDRFVVGPHYDALIDKYFDYKTDIVSLIQAPLPANLEVFVQSSRDHGFIMSLGTLDKSIPTDMANNIGDIWRHLGDRPSTMGNNTLIVDWKPQNDLLGHSKIKAFVAHGGTNGVQEAIYHGFDNLIRVQEKGAGKILKLSEFNSHTFGQILQELLRNASYRTNMQRLSSLHRDQPVRPLDSAVFWIENVVRNKGATHLRSEFYKMPWYLYHSVDVLLVLLLLCLCFLQL